MLNEAQNNFAHFYFSVLCKESWKLPFPYKEVKYSTNRYKASRQTGESGAWGTDWNLEIGRKGGVGNILWEISEL